jgi:hypothetical protein
MPNSASKEDMITSSHELMQRRRTFQNEEEIVLLMLSLKEQVSPIQFSTIVAVHLPQ